ncbi:cytochrome P450 monooxygenase-like protein [Penicillium longicatenatum]|uniref:cytochrome P450 monooxygenase-like protein n=1 Tax=Penicillium longicatenatum TaxID=1561947 RepID=UPI0025493A8E|nr:cytochrome P450 monooxygenase-like protein [Penicillium longicatenatum]KAJ5650867.1 cytochrome P450 monooxygenase-like protein [Penicillium longicatenatum]
MTRNSLATLVISIRSLLKERIEHQEVLRKLIRKRIAKGIDKEHPDFFDQLMNENDKAKAKQLFTTATALAGITYYVLERPECLQALQEEVRNCFTSHTDIDEAKTLRIFVPLSINVLRVSPGAFVDGHYISKGTIVSGHQYTLGHHPKYFTDLESFHPEHSRYAGDNLEASRPFLVGPRTCLGNDLAYSELRLILTKLVCPFYWETVKELDFGKEVDWARDTITQFLWAEPELRVK